MIMQQYKKGLGCLPLCKGCDKEVESAPFVQTTEDSTPEGESTPESASSASSSSSGDTLPHATAPPSMNTLPEASRCVA